MTVWQDELRRDGFTVARGLLPPDVAPAARQSVLRSVAHQLSVLGLEPPEELHTALKMLHGADLDRYKRMMGALWRKADIAGIMHHPEVTGFLRSAFGWNDMFLPGGDVLLLMADDLKIPGGYFGLGAHQDFPSVQGSLDGLVVWIPLTDVDSNSFPLEVLPGSHRRGLVTEVEHTRNGWQIPASGFAEEDFLPVEVKAGDVVFMSYFTVHRSGLRGNRLRIALSTRYDNGDEATYVARTYPTAYQRSVHRDQYLPDFPQPSDLAKIWG
jgi:hypothetical protein